MVARRFATASMLALAAVVVCGCGGAAHVGHARSVSERDAGVVGVCERVRAELVNDVNRQLQETSPAGSLAELRRREKKAYEHTVSRGLAILARATTLLDRMPPNERVPARAALTKIAEHRAGLETVGHELRAHEVADVMEGWSQRVYEFLLGCDQPRPSSLG
jgi:hypothetical protein